jgi:hypothetical protein
MAALAVVSGGRAGSASSTFDLFVQPQYLTAGAQGFAKGEFTAASGPGTGTATHVVMTLDLPVALLSPTSSNCSRSTSSPAGFNRFRCDIGTVKAGMTATRFVRFTAPSTATTYTVNGSVTFDNGSGGAPGGGSVNTTLTKTGQTTVFAATDTTRAGNCTGSASTPSVSFHDAQSTSISGAVASSSLGLPCTWVFVGEDPAPSGSGILSLISFFGLPPTDSPATVVIDFFSLPGPFASLTLFYLPNYPNGPNPLAKVLWPACVGGALPPNETACLLSLEQVGAGARATILALGTGGDPGSGFG